MCNLGMSTKTLQNLHGQKVLTYVNLSHAQVTGYRGRGDDSRRNTLIAVAFKHSILHCECYNSARNADKCWSAERLIV